MMARSFIPMLLLGPTLLLASASSRAEEAADANPPCPRAPRRPPLTSTVRDPRVATSAQAIF
jgi:hypothetical protein